MDEIETLKLEVQGVLLRFLDDRSYRSVGQTKEQVADVRFVAATNDSLENLVESGEFRRDLFHRSAIHVEIPPLRERGNDVILLANHFVSQYCDSNNLVRNTLSNAAIRKLNQYRWPGNVRELKHVIHEAVLICRKNIIGPEDIHFRTGGNPAHAKTDFPRDYRLMPLGEAKALLMAEFERNYIIDKLNGTDGNVTRAAKLSGKSRQVFHKLMQKYDIYSREMRADN